jgi:ketosteroid isomerase-like protein
MSEENIVRFQGVADAFNRMAADVKNLDPADLREWLGFMDPEIRFEPQQAALEGAYAGHAGAGQWLADLAEHYESGHMEWDEVRAAGDHVLGLGTVHIVGQGSGIEADVPSAMLTTWRDGLIVHLRDFGPDRDRALEAAGLSAR